MKMFDLKPRYGFRETLLCFLRQNHVLVPGRCARPSGRVRAAVSDITSRPTLWPGTILPTVTSAPPRPRSPPGDGPYPL